MRYFAANAPKSAKFLSLTAFLWITFVHNLLGCSRMDDIAKQFISASEYKVRYIDREHICAMLFLSAQTLATARARSFNNANALTIYDVCRLFLHNKQASESPAQPQKRINPAYRRLEKNKKYTSPIAQKPLQIRH